jgi:hypothetical protein
MAKWIAVIIFLLIFPFAAYAQIKPITKDDTSMDKWIEQKLGVHIPEIGLSQDWKSMPVVGSCQYEWHVQWKDAKFEIKDGNENYYRVYYQGNTFTMDFKRDFNGFFSS